jgi:putative protease
VRKARFLQDVGFSQMVLARELTLGQIRAVADEVREATLEFFIHGALCVAYSGQCTLSHAHTGRSANRGDCAQPCRLPYTLTDPQGRILAHDKHLLSMKDNDQSANLAALVDAGIRSFKIEGRYKDLGYVKNVTAHYRGLIDALLLERTDLRAASSGRCTFLFTPDPARNFNRGSTDYFVNGRQDDIGAFDSPKHAGLPIGHVVRVGADHFDVALSDPAATLHNGDALTCFDLQRSLVGIQVNQTWQLQRHRRADPGAATGADPGVAKVPGTGTGRAAAAGQGAASRVGAGRDSVWRVEPNEPMSTFKALRRDLPIARNRDMAWNRLLERKSAERRIGVRWRVVEPDAGLMLEVTDDDGHRASVAAPQAFEPAQQGARAEAALREALGRLGGTIFTASGVDVAWRTPRFVPAGAANAWRRAAIERLEVARAAALPRLARAAPVEPPAAYPDDTLSFLGNVFNEHAHRFYLRHGVKVIAAAFESLEERGEVSLMITRHCVRYSLSLCPKQAKGVPGVQGTVRAEPLTMVNGSEKLTLKFDCKACEMHVVGRIRSAVANAVPQAPMRFYRTRPGGRGNDSDAPGSRP